MSASASAACACISASCADVAAAAAYSAPRAASAAVAAFFAESSAARAAASAVVAESEAMAASEAVLAASRASLGGVEAVLAASRASLGGVEGRFFHVAVCLCSCSRERRDRLMAGDVSGRASPCLLSGSSSGSYGESGAGLASTLSSILAANANANSWGNEGMSGFISSSLASMAASAHVCSESGLILLSTPSSPRPVSSYPCGCSYPPSSSPQRSTFPAAGLLAVLTSSFQERLKKKSVLALASTTEDFFSGRVVGAAGSGVAGSTRRVECLSADSSSGVLTFECLSADSSIALKKVRNSSSRSELSLLFWPISLISRSFRISS